MDPSPCAARQLQRVFHLDWLAGLERVSQRGKVVGAMGRRDAREDVLLRDLRLLIRDEEQPPRLGRTGHAVVDAVQSPGTQMADPLRFFQMHLAGAELALHVLADLLFAEGLERVSDVVGEFAEKFQARGRGDDFSAVDREDAADLGILPQRQVEGVRGSMVLAVRGPERPDRIGIGEGC